MAATRRPLRIDDGADLRAGHEAVRRRNLGAILRHVHLHGATSRAELTVRLGLSRSAIGALCADLTGAGLVSEETVRDTGRAGRPSLVVRPQTTLVYAYALSIEVDRLRAARVGLGGAVLDSRTIDRPRGRQLLDSIGPLAALVHDLQRTVPADAQQIGGGLAVAGLGRRENGLRRVGPHLGAAQISAAQIGAALVSEIGSELSLVVGNVADLGALAERTRGAATGLDNVIYLHGDLGIDAGIVVAGRRVTGHDGYGGDVGHMVVNPDGRRCGCGSRGCWESEVGESALLRHAGREHESSLDAVLAVVDAAAAGDRRAATAIAHVADWLGFGVANLVTIFNPAAVVFGGILRPLFLAGSDKVRSRIEAMVSAPSREHLQLRTPTLGDDAPVRGAAELAFEMLLANPVDSSPD